MILLAVAPAIAQIPPAVRFVIGGLNAQLPRQLDKDVTLLRVAADGDAVDVVLQIEPTSPLALGIDVRREAARLCGIDVFRKLTALMKAKLRITYVKPDQSPIGAFEIDRTICSAP